LGEQLPNCVHLKPVDVTYFRRKRIFDIMGSAILLLLLSPIMLLIALLIKITDPGPVLYISKRVGLCGRLFNFLKFRSMYVDADGKKAELLSQNEREGPIFKMKNDPRVTPIGRFLRKYSLDELPQLINVFMGQMSLVGPRPPIAKEVLEYKPSDLERLRIKPGITCYWQVMGRSNLTFDEWMELDKKYIRDMSLWTDLKILIKTPIAVIRGDGAY
jgi:exopolysaccharide biosynthesis polyprenyl glycosylphosphotransferase